MNRPKTAEQPRANKDSDWMGVFKESINGSLFVGVSGYGLPQLWGTHVRRYDLHPMRNCFAEWQPRGQREIGKLRKL